MATTSRADERSHAARATTRRRRRRRVLFAVLVVLALWAVVVVWLAQSAQSHLVQARAAMVEGRAALLDGDVAAANGAFRRGHGDFQAAAGRLGTPVVVVAGAVPILGNSLETARALADGGVLVADAALLLTTALGGDAGGLSALAPRGGAIPLEPIEALAGPLAEAQTLLEQAGRRIGGAPSRWLVARVADAREEFVTELTEAHRTVAVGAELARALPLFLGATEPRRYFFGAQNPAELRGTGGLIGAFAILEIDQGQLSFSDFEPVQDLPNLPASAIEAPNPSYAERYDRWGGAGFWLNINMTPDFPSAATAIERLYERVEREQLDGTILADPFAFAALLEISGAVTVPDYGEVDADSVVAFVANEAYGLITNPEERKGLLGQVAARALQGFLTDSGAQDPATAGEVLAQAAANGHLLLHATDEEVQAAFLRAGVAGALHDPPGDFLAVIGNNAAANKTDFYAERRVHYEVTLEPDGYAHGRATVRLVNHAPRTGQPEYVIGPNTEEVVAGQNSTILSVYCAVGCGLLEFQREKAEDEVAIQTELGHPVFSAPIRLQSGESETVRVAWRVPTAWEAAGDGGSYRFTFQNQPMIRPATLLLEVEVPDGYEVADASPGMEVEGRRVVWEGEPARLLTLEVEFTRPLSGWTRAWRGLLDVLREPIVEL